MPGAWGRPLPSPTAAAAADTQRPTPRALAPTLPSRACWPSLQSGAGRRSVYVHILLQPLVLIARVPSTDAGERGHCPLAEGWGTVRLADTNPLASQHFPGPPCNGHTGLCPRLGPPAERKGCPDRWGPGQLHGFTWAAPRVHLCALGQDAGKPGAKRFCARRTRALQRTAPGSVHLARSWLPIQAESRQLSS